MKTIVRYFVTFMAIAAVLSCGEKEPVGGGGLGVNMEGAVLGFDKNVIKADGSDKVTFTAYYDGNNVDGSATVYIKNESGKFVPTGKTFSTDKVGDYYFKLMYKTNQSEIVTISAISREIPAAVADPQPGKTSFVHRTFFNQFTGADCPNCPYMVHLINQALEDGYDDKVVVAAIRNYNNTEAGFANIPCPGSGYPYLHIDYATSYNHAGGSPKGLQALIDQRVSTPAKVGISANTKYYEDGQIIVRVAVKAAQTGDYNVGLWLMQDDYYMPQSFKNDIPGALDGTWDTGYNGDSSKNRYDYHHNAVRVAASMYMGSHVGFPLGTIQAGKTAEWIFAVNVNLGTEEYGYTDHWWEGQTGGIKLDNLHFAAFVTSHQGTRYTVENAVEFKYNGSKAFDYK
ncbi:MAG: Omp28-related outer membrane protein [Bacteroidales bacterium]|nr:Omp28-related outer membrane protein [Bacteroidales bacterium]